MIYLQVETTRALQLSRNGQRSKMPLRDVESRTEMLKENTVSVSFLLEDVWA
jgi:hypothetical protein